ncbi:hypothetical protein IFM89_009439 [Coptis chinensis]|uniref:E3 ubiquitin-protein ligase RMA n=1 Tax=Coptis chinensis TaxID=261450 RepID=A0A835LZ31_9MAGN|nr:hypothetical protein IFM89_009439 [Coptis chinensis]
MAASSLGILCLVFLFLASGVMSAALKKAVHVTFNRNYVPTWAFDHIKYFNGGNEIQLLIDKYTMRYKSRVPYGVEYDSKVRHFHLQLDPVFSSGGGTIVFEGLNEMDGTGCYFMWSFVLACLYRWLHIHCDHRECPVCKGEVTEADITPIYGRGNSKRKVEERGKRLIRFVDTPKTRGREGRKV